MALRALPVPASQAALPRMGKGGREGDLIMRVFRPYAWFGPIAAVVMVVCGAAPAAAQPEPAGSGPPILPASKLGSNWVLSKPPVTTRSRVQVDYENRVDYPA